MQHCGKCNVNIRGNKTQCPLCHGKLTGEPENPAFKPMPVRNITGSMFIKICTFIFVCINVIMMGIELIGGFKLYWPWAVMVFSIFAIIDIHVGFYLRGNLLNMITVQTWILMIFIYAIDVFYNRRAGFSITWVIPFMFISLLIVTLSIGLINGLHTVDYVIYLLADTLLSYLQIIFIFNGKNTRPVPAVISIMMLTIYIAYVLIFRWRDISSATSKYMNF